MKLTIDMFASRLNKKLANYVAWQPESDALAIDALNINWESHSGFLFQPFNMIGKVLGKSEADSATGIVVVPFWTTETWFPKFVDMAEGDIYYFDTSTDRLSLLSDHSDNTSSRGKPSYLQRLVKAKTAYRRLFHKCHQYYLCIGRNSTSKIYNIYNEKWTIVCKEREILPTTGTVQKWA